ncbi:Ff.00g096260.m01.CDS01 [Fusarium sp. VM40]|nr:Ff.00g096260.m01.CDS01 [Fusarium sp. VM40]
MSWRISDLEIIATYRIDLYSKGVEKEANSFDWDHDFYDIDRDEKIIWSDANSTKTAADNLQTKFGDGKDGLIPADNRESIRHLVYQHKQHGCDLMARMPD